MQVGKKYTRKSPVVRLGFSIYWQGGREDAVQLKHKGLQAGTELPVASRSPVCRPLFPCSRSQIPNSKKAFPIGKAFKLVAERTGLEPATPGVTGRYSNQLNYRSAIWLAFR